MDKGEKPLRLLEKTGEVVVWKSEEVVHRFPQVKKLFLFSTGDV